MKLKFVDTNIFLRHLTNDEPVQAGACFELFKKADRDEVALTTSESVLAEVVYLLSSRAVYNLPPETIKAMLYQLISLKGFKLGNKRLYLRALDLYGMYKFDFEDCLSIAHMEEQNLEEIYSYDQDFDRIGNVKRMEPRRQG